jgi:hypothetical protein
MATVPHSSRGHSDLPPSSADKWMMCFGWLATVRQHRARFGRAPSSAAADEGTRAHEKMELHLQPRSVLGTEGVPLTDADDEYDDLLPCLEWVEQQPGELHLETRVDVGAQFGYVGLTGTMDIVLVEPDRITVADLKYGRGLVEVKGNHQLMNYLVGVVDRFGSRQEYRLVILQPRAWHPDGSIREHTVSHAELEVYKFDLENAIEANYRGGQCNPGDHCRKYCEALSSCKAVAQVGRRRLAETPIEEDET